MNVGDYAAGTVALVLTIVPWVLASAAMRRRLVPEWIGATGWLAQATLGIGSLVVVAELLGIAGWFSRWPVAAVSAGVAAAVTLLCRRGPDVVPPVSASPDAGRSAPARRTALVLAGLAALAVSAALLGRDARVLHTGPDDLDSLHYHLSQAADFATSHSLDHLHQTAASDASVFYPYDAELLDGVGMLGPHPDIATLLLNIGFGWLALLACWVIGARWSVGPAAVAAGAAVLALPLLAANSSGPGLDDIPSTAFFLAAVGFLVTAGVPRGATPVRRWSAQLALAGLALGLAAGSKLSLLAPVVLLALGIVAFARGDRWRAAAAIVPTAVVTGGFWYIRDWVLAGSPVPGLNLVVAGHGLHEVPNPEVAPYAFTIAHYLGNFSVMRHWFEPGLRVVWTDVWPLVGLLMVAGVLLAILRDRQGVRRMLGLVTLLAVAAYIVTPTTALGPAGQPVLFAANTRYAVPEMMLAVVLAATAESVRRWTLPVTAGFTALTLGLLSASRSGRFIDRFDGLAAALIVLVALGMALAVHRRYPGRVAGAGMSLASIVVVVGAGAAVQRHYIHDRYAAATTSPTTARSQQALFAWGNDLTGQRIGVVGHALQYPFYGPTLDNEVGYVGVEAPDHSYAAPTTCVAWREALEVRHDTYVVIEPLAAEHTARLASWTRSMPGASVAFHDAAGTAYRLPAVISSAGCVAP